MYVRSIAHTWFGRVISNSTQQIGIDLVARLRFRRARTAVERLDPHPPHERFHMPAADGDPFGNQETAQHPCSRKRELQMQFVDPPHDTQVGSRHRTRQVVDA